MTAEVIPIDANSAPPQRADEGEHERAARIIAASNYALAAAIKPGADALDHFAKAQIGVGVWIQKRGPWLLSSIPVLLISLNAISPDAAKGLHRALVALGIAP
jgi:hypothetical protein